MLFEIPLLFDPEDEGILVVTKETNLFYLHFSKIIYDDLGIGPDTRLLHSLKDRNFFSFVLSGPAFMIFWGMKFLI